MKYLNDMQTRSLMILRQLKLVPLTKQREVNEMLSNKQPNGSSDLSNVRHTMTVQCYNSGLRFDYVLKDAEDDGSDIPDTAVCGKCAECIYDVISLEEELDLDEGGYYHAD